jgi:hypothetical protein
VYYRKAPGIELYQCQGLYILKRRLFKSKKIQTKTFFLKIPADPGKVTWATIFLLKIPSKPGKVT